MTESLGFNAVSVITQNRKHLIRIPKTWDTMPLATYMRIVEVFSRDFTGLGVFPENVPIVLKTSLLITLSNRDMSFWRNLEQEFQNQDGKKQGRENYLNTLNQLLPVTDFLFKKTKNGIEVNFGRTKNPFPEIFCEPQKIIADLYRQKNKAQMGEVKKHYDKTIGEVRRVFGSTTTLRWLGPADAFQNLSFYELCNVFQQFETYVRNGYKESDICTLIAQLWRPTKAYDPESEKMNYHGDRRIAFRGSESTVAKRAEMVALLPPSVRRAILYWFLGCRAQLFAHPVIGRLFQSGSGEADQLNLGMYNILIALGQSNAFSSLNDAGDTNALTALTVMAKMNHDYEKMKNE